MKTHILHKPFVLLCALFLLMVALAPAALAVTYYSQGSVTPNTLANWNTVRAGGGSVPANFTTAGDTFAVQNGHNMTNTAAWAVTGNKIQIESGGLLMANSTFIVSCTTFQIDNGGTYIHNAGNSANASATDIPGTSRSFGASSTVEIRKWGDGTGTSPNALPSGISWGNLTINVGTLAGSWNQSGGISTINGNFLIKATGGGTFEFRLSSTTLYTLTIGGDLTIQGGILSGYSNTAMLDGCAINLYGNYSQSAGTTFKTTSTSSGGLITFTFDSTGGPAAVNFTQAGTFNVNRIKFVVGAGKTVTLNSAFAAGATAPTGSIVVNGTLLCNGFNVTGSHPFTLAAGGTLGITSASGITSTAATGNIQSTGTRTFDTAAGYIYYGSAAAAVTGNQLPTTVTNLTINNVNGVTLSQNVQVNGTTTMTAGAVTLGGNTLSYGASGTLLYNGASSQTTAAAEFPASSGPANLTITNSSGVTLNFARTIAGTLTMTSGNLTTTSANLLTIGSAGGTSGGSASSYVNGPLARVYGSTGSKNFPTGVGSFRQVAVNLTGISGTPTITVTPNEPSAWSGANTPASTTMFGTRDWTVNASGAGNTASITVDGTGFSPAGAARTEVYDGTATTAFTPTFASPNYTATGIALASGNNEVALGDLACSAPTTPTFASVTAPGCSPVSVIWNTASGAASYDLFRKVSGGSYPATPIAAGLTATNYTDSDITNAVTYVYQVKAYSACGAFSLSADSTGATPTTAPFITNNPSSYVSYEGFAAPFTVGARGDGLTYQWQVNNGGGFVNVTGADGTGGTTATFTTVNATTGMNNNQYRCVVSGTCSPAATSTVATLTIGTQFRSLATGAWATNTSWQISADGSTWTNAPTGIYPGATAGHTDTVQVRSAHNIILATNATASAGALTVDATGKVSIGDQLSATDANTFLQIAGNLVNNGTITAGQGNNNRIIFNGTTTWTGSGDITCGGQGKLGFTVNTGSTLTLSVDISLRTSTSQAVITINGTLNAGTRFMRQVTASGSSSASLIIGPGATVETANASGIGSVSQVTSGFFQSPFGTITIDPSANFIFDGTVNQTMTATATNGGISTVLSAANNVTIRNTGGGGANTVTNGTIAISGTLYVQNGLVSFGSTTTSTAGALTFDGSTYQTTGTWGNVGSGASNTDATRFAGTGYVTVSGPIAVTSSTQFRSHTSGNWNVAGTWEGSADGGTTWSALLTGFTPGSTPGSTHKVYVQAGHVVTLTEDEACNDLNMSVGTTSSTTGGGGGKIACVTNTLSVNGQLRGYWAPVSTTPGTDQPSGSAFDPFTKTDAGGKVKFVGAGRVILATGQWGSYNITATPVSPGGAADWEFALTAGQTATNLSSFRPANVVIDSGTTLDIGSIIIGACGNGGLGVGTGGAGNITISNGATLISSGSGVISRRTSTASSGAIGTFANQGTLKLSGAAPMIAAAAYDFTGGTVEYNGANQTLLVKDSGTSGPQTDPTNYNTVTLSGTGVKTTPTNIWVNGTLNVSSGTTLDFSSKTITAASAPTLNGALLMQVARTGANTFTGSQLIQTAGTLTYGGTLTVTNTGSAVALGESIPLFNSTGGYAGSFGSVAFSPLVSGLSASISSGNLTIVCNGTLAAGAAANTTNCVGSSYSLNGSASGGGGGYTYSWVSSPAGFTSSSANPSVSPTATTTYNLTVTDANGCTAAAMVTVTVNPSPTITLGSSPSVVYGSTSATLPYTGTTQSPNQYSIVFDAAAQTAGFANVSLTALPVSPIALTVPATAPVGTYNGTVSVQTAAGCASSAVAFTVTVTAKSLTITANDTNKLYGQTVTFAGTEFSTAGLINSDSVASVSLTSAGSVSTAAVGTYSIVPGSATGSGLTNYSLTYSNGTLTVNPATVALSVSSSSNPSGFNDSLTFTANLTPTNASGTVQFRTNGVNFGTAATLVAGSASSASTTSLPRGNNTIAAVYSGDGNYLAITNTLTQVVTNHPPVANPAAYTRNTAVNTFKVLVSVLLTNATDVDGDTLTLNSVSATTNNASVMISGGYVMYANTNAVADEFTYTVIDGFGGTNSATVTINVDSTPLFGQSQIVSTSGGTATLNFAGIPGYSYSVQRSTNLTSWIVIWTTNAPAGGVFQFIDAAAPDPSAYYQLRYNP